MLCNKRATPHTSTGIPPYTTRQHCSTDRYAQSYRNSPPAQTRDSLIRDKDDATMRKIKEYADSKRYIKPTNLFEGDMVLAKRKSSHKNIATPYDPKPYIVSQRKGAMITAKRTDKEIKRNSSLFKRVDPHTALKPETEIDDEELELGLEDPTALQKVE